MVVLARTPVRMDVAAFLRWDAGDGLRYELVDGAPHAMAPASTVHGLLQAELARLIGNFFRERGSSCEILANPGVVPRLFSAHNCRVPDLAITCAAILPGQATLPDPVVLIEILSPSNEAKTWANVWAYTSIHSVRDILVLRTDRVGGDILSRASDGAWPEATQDLGTGLIEIASIGFQVPLIGLYARTGL